MADWQYIHSTTLIVDGLDCSVPTPEYAAKLDAAGVKCMHLTIEDMDSRGALYPFERVFDLLDAPGCRFRLARSAMEIEAVAADGMIALVLGRQASDPINVAHGNLRSYYELGLRITGFAYNTSNRYGGGCLTPDAPLTDDGKALVNQANRLGMLLDVGGHTAERTSFDVIARAEGRPVVCTHCGAGGLNPNLRNSSDRLCEAIAATGGVVGMVALSDFLARHAGNAHEPVTPLAGVDLMLDHLDYLKRLIGIEHIALGPDFIEGLALEDPGAYPGDRFPAEMVSADFSVLFVEGFESIDKLPSVTQLLLSRGWTTTELRKLLGGNWMRVFRSAWGS